MAKGKVLVPSYMKDFICIGSDCEDTCCQKWSISVSKNNYKNFKKLRKTDYANYVNENIIINTKKNADNKNYYALIKLRDDGFCPFLDDNMLCNIYLKYGEDYMPYTCIVYPRDINAVGSDIEMSLIMSCPEAARKALGSTQLMEFEHIYMDISKYNLFRILSINEQAYKKEHKYFWNIRIAAISILQNRDFDISIRFVLLGMLYKRIQKLIDEENYNDIALCVTEFIDSIDNDIYRQTFATMKKNLNVQMAMYRVLISEYLLETVIVGEKAYSYIEDAVKFLADNDEEKYKDINNSKFIDFMEKEAQIVIEHFMVNEFYRMLMPFDNKFENMYDSLIYMCGNYGVIKSLVMSQISKNGNITKDEMIDMLSKMAKSFIHNASYNKYITDLVKVYDLDSLGGLYTLVCN